MVAPDSAAHLAAHQARGEEQAIEVLTRVAELESETIAKNRRWVGQRQLVSFIRRSLIGVAESLRSSVAICLVHRALVPQAYTETFRLGRADALRALLEGVQGAQPVFSFADVKLILDLDDAPRRSWREGADSSFRLAYFALLIDGLDRLSAEHQEVSGLADEVATRLAHWNPALTSAQQEQMIVLRKRLAGLGATSSESASEPPAVHGVDGFGVAVLAALGDSPYPRGVNALLRHLGTATSARPSTKWSTTCKRLLDETDNADELICTLLSLVVSAPALPFERWGRVQPLLLDGNTDLVRGTVWATELLGVAWAPDMLRDVTERCLREARGRTLRPVAVQGEKVPFACIDTLARIGSPEALAMLAEFRQLIEHRAVSKRIESALAHVAGEQGVHVDELIEQNAPDYGLDSAGRRSFQVGTWTATIAVGGASGSTIEWRDGAANVVVGPDSDENGEEVEAVDELARRIGRAVNAERSRIESLFVRRQYWSSDAFWRTYVEHPLSGWFGRQLLWTWAIDHGVAVGLPLRERPLHMETPSGEVLMLGHDAEIRIWHPLDVDDEQLRDIRALLRSRDVQQPIRQAWREVFVRNDAERDALASERYAGHVLRANQLYALSKSKGWSGGFLSSVWDGGQSANPNRLFTDYGLKAVWTIADFDWMVDPRPKVGLAVSDQLHFESAEQSEGATTPVPLDQVPSIVFSEAMRDLDFFVSTCSIATDLTWLEKMSGERGLDEYWQRISVEGLATTLETRRAALEELLTLGILSGPYSLGERWLEVHGVFGTYSIDLATANVRLDPPGRWLTIRPTKRSTTDSEHSMGPLDDDEILWRIIERAANFAQDRSISDKRLLAQLRAG